MRSLNLLTAVAQRVPVSRRIGRVHSISSASIVVTGLSDVASVGHRVSFPDSDGVCGEVVGVSQGSVQVMPDAAPDTVKIGQVVKHLGEFRLYPDESWLGRVIDADGAALDGQPLAEGLVPVELNGQPPLATTRRSLGARLATGYALLDTILPIVRGQRQGLFAGSGVGKSSLMAALARDVEADVIVIAMIGERGREVNDFIRRVLGKRGLERTVVVAATSDQSALSRRRAAFSAMAVAEYFRRLGRQVMLMLDSITRLAEAHREISAASGEASSMRGHPASLVQMLAGFVERAGPGAGSEGDITAIFTVLVAASDMDEPVADTLRGLLDGHIVLSRDIAERGRFPAVDVLQSVSRALPEAAAPEENALISQARRALSVFEESEIMVRSGLYQRGTNTDLDRAIELRGQLEDFSETRTDGIASSFRLLKAALSSDSEASEDQEDGAAD